jgi:hypothetical protein
MGDSIKARGDEVAIPSALDLRGGNCYLIEEDRHSRSFELFSELISNGAQGVCYTREYPNIIKKKYKLENVPVFWLCYSIGERRINPKSLNQLARDVTKFLHQNDEGVVLLDGIEYLIINNDFNEVLRTLHRMCEAVMQNSSRLIIPLNPETLNKKEVALLERNMEVIDSK